MPWSRVLLWFASLGGMLLLARSLLIGAVSPSVSVIAVVAYIAIVLAGVFHLPLEMYVDAFTSGPDHSNEVVLTFDDGPDPSTTPRVLDALEEASVVGTFFVVGHKVDQFPELARSIVERGHTLGLHSYAHDRLFAFRSGRYVKRDLVRARDAVRKATGLDVLLFRPPIGHTNPTIARVVRELGLQVIGWSVRGYDGLAGRDRKTFEARVARGIGPGSVVLLHDAAEKGDFMPVSVEALPSVLKAIRERGLCVVPLQRWLGG